MATWIEKQRDKAKREKLSREMTHEQFTAPENPVGEAITQWGRGVAERSTPQGYLSALASEAQRYRQMPPEELAGQFGAQGGGLSGLAGIFAGKGAKTANLANLEIAQKLKQQGVSDPEIWKQTGWTLDTPDKVPRFEISDKPAKFRETPRENLIVSMPTDRAISHPELFGAYPESRDIKTMFDESSGGKYEGGRITTGTADAPYPMGTQLHELQHAIQQREGFARGGSPDALQLEYNNALARLNFLEKEPDLIEGQKKIDALWRDVFDTQKISPEQATEIERGIYAAYPSLKEAKDVMQTLRTVGDDSGYNAYKRLAGEAEARLTQARMTMTPEQRLANYPYQPEYFQQATGVPLKDLIVRKDGGTAMSIPQGNDIPQLISDMAEKRRIYEAQRAAAMQAPQQSRVSNVLTGAGALGAGTAAGYYGLDALYGNNQ